MRMYDKLIFVFFGAAFWVLGTIWYQLRGPQVFESTSQRLLDQLRAHAHRNGSASASCSSGGGMSRLRSGPPQRS